MTAPAECRCPDSARNPARWDDPSPSNDTPPAWSIVRRERTGWEKTPAMNVSASYRCSGGSGRRGRGRARLQLVANLGQQPNFVRRSLRFFSRRLVHSVHQLHQDEYAKGDNYEVDQRLNEPSVGNDDGRIKG